MSKVYCASCECKYSDDNGLCQKDKIGLSFCYVNTVNDGHQNFWRCTSFEERDDEQYLRLKAFAKKMNDKSMR